MTILGGKVNDDFVHAAAQSYTWSSFSVTARLTVRQKYAVFAGAGVGIAIRRIAVPSARRWRGAVARSNRRKGERSRPGRRRHASTRELQVGICYDQNGRRFERYWHYCMPRWTRRVANLPVAAAHCIPGCSAACVYVAHLPKNVSVTNKALSYKRFFE
jgi:hypothetical protein